MVTAASLSLQQLVVVNLPLLLLLCMCTGEQRLISLKCCATVICQTLTRGSSPANILSWFAAAAAVCTGEQRLINLKCRATIGAVSNPQNKNRVLGKAGASRNLGRRPSVSTHLPSNSSGSSSSSFVTSLQSWLMTTACRLHLVLWEQAGQQEPGQEALVIYKKRGYVQLARAALRQVRLLLASRNLGRRPS
jgi:hypothetical protein